MSSIASNDYTVKSTLRANRIDEISSSTIFERIAFYGFGGAVVLFAIPYGTVQPWQKSLLIVTICVFALFRLTDAMIRRSFRLSEPWMFLPLIGVVFLALGQVVVWPGTDGAISVDPYETTVFVMIFSGLLVAAEILFAYTTSVRRLRALIYLVIAVGFGSAVFGFIRVLFFDGPGNELSGYLAPDQGYAQFINRNHFALLMEMSLGLVLGLLIKGGLSELQKFAGWILAGAMLYSIIAANSRGGLISLAALSLFAVFVHVISGDTESAKSEFRSRRPKSVARSGIKKIATAVALCVFVSALIVVTVAFVGGDTVVTRVERNEGEVASVDGTQVNRSSIWKSTIALINDRPVFGAGFGGYSAAIPKFDTMGGGFSLQQAHNDYLEILANGGIVGFALFAAFGLIAASRLVKNLKAQDPLRRAACFGAMIGIFGVLIHSFVDFGLHIPVNALIFTTLLVIGAANISDLSQNGKKSAARRSRYA